MKLSDLKATDTLCLHKDERGYIHIRVYRGDKGIETVEMTLSPERAGVPHVNRIIVFLKERFIPVLKSQGIISDFFQSKEGVWCGFLNIDVYFELENSHNQMYTKKLIR